MQLILQVFYCLQLRGMPTGRVYLLNCVLSATEIGIQREFYFASYLGECALRIYR